MLHTVPLAQAMAVSSSFLAAARDAIPDDLAFAREWLSTETLLNWGVLPNEDNSKCRVGNGGYLGGAIIVV